MENKKVKCIKNGVTGECYDIVDKNAQDRLAVVEDSLSKITGTDAGYLVTDEELEEAIADKITEDELNQALSNISVDTSDCVKIENAYANSVFFRGSSGEVYGIGISPYANNNAVVRRDEYGHAKIKSPTVEEVNSEDATNEAFTSLNWDIVNVKLLREALSSVSASKKYLHTISKNVSMSGTNIVFSFNLLADKETSMTGQEIIDWLVNKGFVDADNSYHASGFMGYVDDTRLYNFSITGVFAKNNELYFRYTGYNVSFSIVDGEYKINNIAHTTTSGYSLVTFMFASKVAEV